MNTTESAPAVTPKLHLHNGTYTVTHPTRGHYTVRVHTAKRGQLAGKRVVSLLTGPDNTSDYRAFAFWDDERRVAFSWRSFRGEGSNGAVDGTRYSSAPSWSKFEQKLAILLALTVVATDGPVPTFADGCSVATAGHCVRCNRLLTTPESIARGIGPECAEKVGH